MDSKDFQLLVALRITRAGATGRLAGESRSLLLRFETGWSA